MLMIRVKVLRLDHSSIHSVSIKKMFVGWMVERDGQENNDDVCACFSADM